MQFRFNLPEPKSQGGQESFKRQALNEKICERLPFLSQYVLSACASAGSGVSALRSCSCARGIQARSCEPRYSTGQSSFKENRVDRLLRLRKRGSSAEAFGEWSLGSFERESGLNIRLMTVVQRIGGHKLLADGLHSKSVASRGEIEPCKAFFEGNVKRAVSCLSKLQICYASEAVPLSIGSWTSLFSHD